MFISIKDEGFSKFFSHKPKLIVAEASKGKSSVGTVDKNNWKKDSRGGLTPPPFASRKLYTGAFILGRSSSLVSYGLLRSPTIQQRYSSLCSAEPHVRISACSVTSVIEATGDRAREAQEGKPTGAAWVGMSYAKRRSPDAVSRLGRNSSRNGSGLHETFAKQVLCLLQKASLNFPNNVETKVLNEAPLLDKIYKCSLAGLLACQ